MISFSMPQMGFLISYWTNVGVVGVGVRCTNYCRGIIDNILCSLNPLYTHRNTRELSTNYARKLST